MITGLELALATHLLVNASAGAAPVTCPAQQKATVNIKWRADPVRYNFTQSENQLRKMHIDTVNPYGKQVRTDVGGLMSGSIQVKSNFQVSNLGYESLNLVCLWMDQVNIDISMAPTIYIASEHKQGTCRHNAVMEHELKHVATDKQIAAEYTPKIKAALNNALARVGVVGPKPMREQPAYQKKMMDYLGAEVRKVTDQMYEVRKQRQQAVDSLAEYERVSRLCPR